MNDEPMEPAANPAEDRLQGPEIVLILMLMAAFGGGFYYLYGPLLKSMAAQMFAR